MGAYGVIGDPAGMRQLAAQCRAHAAQLSELAARAEQTVNGMRFEAPAANRIRERVRHQSAGRRADAQALSALADRLAQGASRVEREVADRRRAARRAAEARAKSAGGGGGGRSF